MLDAQAEFTWGFGQEVYVDASNTSGLAQSLVETTQIPKGCSSISRSIDRYKRIMQTNEDPTSPRVQRRMLQEMIERFAVKHAVSTDVAKQMISDRHNKLVQEADDAIATVQKGLPVSIDGA